MPQPPPSDSLKDRSFVLFTATQYLGAFNDNIFKQVILLLAAKSAVDRQGLATMVFSLPFLLFSGYAGQLSERFPKTSVMRLSKVGEALIMILGGIGFYLGDIYFLFAILFLMGAQSAFFGPSKYGVIPELIAERRLVPANGVVYMTTFAAIITGLALAGFLAEIFAGRLHYASGVCMAVAALGIVTVYLIAPRVANRPELKLSANPFGSVWVSVKEMAADKPLFYALIAHSYFWFSGTIVTVTVNNYGLNLLGLDKIQVSLMLVTMTVGIMVGCLSTAPIERRIGSKNTIVTGAFGVAIAEFFLFFHLMPFPMIHGLLFISGACAGYYFVPVAAFLQARPALGRKGEVLAAVNFCSFVGMLLAGITWEIMMRLGMPANYAWWFLSGGLFLMIAAMWPQLKAIQPGGSSG